MFFVDETDLLLQMTVHPACASDIPNQLDYFNKAAILELLRMTNYNAGGQSWPLALDIREDNKWVCMGSVQAVLKGACLFAQGVMWSS